MRQPDPRAERPFGATGQWSPWAIALEPYLADPISRAFASPARPKTNKSFLFFFTKKNKNKASF
jgi:hypothetical protein